MQKEIKQYHNYGKDMSQEMHIGYLTTSLASDGGWGRYSKSLVESIMPHADVTVLMWKDGPNESKTLSVDQILPPFDFSFSTQLKVALACLRHFRDKDIIHSLVEAYAPGAALAAWLMRKTFVMTLHGTYSIPPTGFNRHGILLRLAYRIATHTTTGSFGTAEKVRAAGARLTRCEFIPNGVDEHIFHHDNLLREQFILTVGEIKPRKGADLGVRALALLRDEFPSLKYTIVGTYHENEFVETIRSIAREARIEDRVLFTGRLNDNKLVSLYNRCTAFLLAARDTGYSFEGFPMVYYEANMCGAPVITTTGFGSEYAIHTGVNGYLVPPDDPAAIAERIRAILVDASLQARLTAGALEEAGKHTWGAIAPRLINFYLTALA